MFETIHTHTYMYIYIPLILNFFLRMRSWFNKSNKLRTFTSIMWSFPQCTAEAIVGHKSLGGIDKKCLLGRRPLVKKSKYLGVTNNTGESHARMYLRLTDQPMPSTYTLYLLKFIWSCDVLRLWTWLFSYFLCVENYYLCLHWLESLEFLYPFRSSLPQF